jgi:hypothetical protein
MKPFLLCVLFGMNPSHIASISHVYESEVVEFTRGSVFACVKGEVPGASLFIATPDPKEEKREILIERDLDIGKKTSTGGVK